MTSSKQKQSFIYSFFDKRTVPSVIVLWITGLIIAQFLPGTLFAVIAGKIFGKNEETALMFLQFGSIVGSFVLLFLFYRFFYPEYEGSLRGGNRVGLFVSAALIISAGMLAISLFTGGGQEIGFPPAVNIVAAFAAGISEEAVFRGVITSYLMRQWQGRGRIFTVILVSSAIFGLYHIMNLFSRAPLGITLTQIVYAFSIGCLYCALFLRSGSLIPAMLLHSLNDIGAFLNVSNFREGGGYTSGTAISLSGFAVTLVMDAVFILIMLFFTRPSVRDSIVEVWNKKWRKENNQDESDDLYSEQSI